MIRVAVVDDHPHVAIALRAMLDKSPDIQLVAESRRGGDVPSLVRQSRPDVLLLDLKWFGDESAGIDAIRRLASEVPETRVVAITVYPHLIELAKSAGALAALNKEVPKQQLIEEIRSVHAASNLPAALVPRRGLSRLRAERATVYRVRDEALPRAVLRSGERGRLRGTRPGYDIVPARPL